MDLRSLLPQLLPAAIAWANAQAEHVAQVGQPLTPPLIDIARRVGVKEPERIRVLLVDQLPLPEDAVLREVAIQEGLLGPSMAGLTLGHSIFIVHGNCTLRLVSHECRHVHQYEVVGSIEAFLPIYLGQIIEYKYEDAPLEVDARNYEIVN